MNPVVVSDGYRVSPLVQCTNCQGLATFIGMHELVDRGFPRLWHADTCPTCSLPLRFGRSGVRHLKYAVSMGGAGSSPQGDSLSTIMPTAYWKNPKTAWRYIRLVEVLAPGSEGLGMVTGEKKYRELSH